jgi:AcrR family transcriptional regulator
MKRTLKAGRRARGDDQKALRREAIVEVARKLFERKDFEALSMDEIARRARLAKGTLYLYFRTKEELFLEIHRADYAAWFAEFRDWLETLGSAPRATPRALAGWIVGSFRRHERFLRILPLLGPVLERNLSFEAALGFKRALLGEMEGAAAQLARLLGVSPASAVSLLMRLHALVLGATVQCAAPPVLEAFLEKDERFAPFREDFETVLRELVETYLRGYLAAVADAR